LRRRRPRYATPLDLAVAAGITPDDWQATALTVASPRLLFCCSRQSGKTTTAAIVAVHQAVTRAGALVLIVAPSLRQSTEALRRCSEIHDALPHQAAPVQASTVTLELVNGARVIALPGNEATIRGISAVDLLIVDESARVSDQLYFSTRPMLAVSGGRLIALSTPYGKRGWWHAAWTDGGDAWQRITATAADCPRIPASFLEEERRALPREWFAQEYECAFVDVIDAAFTADELAAVVTPAVTPLFGVA
jgi:hypothetical protein